MRTTTIGFVGLAFAAQVLACTTESEPTPEPAKVAVQKDKVDTKGWSCYSAGTNCQVCYDENGDFSYECVDSTITYG